MCYKKKSNKDTILIYTNNANINIKEDFTIYDYMYYLFNTERESYLFNVRLYMCNENKKLLK